MTHVWHALPNERLFSHAYYHAATAMPVLRRPVPEKGETSSVLADPKRFAGIVCTVCSLCMALSKRDHDYMALKHATGGELISPEVAPHSSIALTALAHCLRIRSSRWPRGLQHLRTVTSPAPRHSLRPRMRASPVVLKTQRTFAASILHCHAESLGHLGQTQFFRREGSMGQNELNAALQLR